MQYIMLLLNGNVVYYSTYFSGKNVDVTPTYLIILALKSVDLIVAADRLTHAIEDIFRKMVKILLYVGKVPSYFVVRYGAH